MESLIRFPLGPGLLLISFSLAAAEPQSAAQAQGAELKRTVLSRVEVPDSNYEVVTVLVEAPPHASAGPHTHPGTVVGYVIAGDYTMLVEGQAPRALKPGDHLQLPAGVVHDERSGAQPAKLLVVFTVEKGKPLATPAGTKETDE